MRRCGNVILCVVPALLAAGCPKGKPNIRKGVRPKRLPDYDAALAYYQQALKADPITPTSRLKLTRSALKPANPTLRQGLDMREKGDLQGAAGRISARCD